MSVGLGPLSAMTGGVRLLVLVQPRASRSGVAGLHDGRVRIRLAAPPVDGAANEELIRFLAATLGIAKTAVRIDSGASSRRKALYLAGVSLTAAHTLLEGGGD